MFSEISLHILDILQNCVRAEATEISVSIVLPEKSDELSIEIHDNGNGMTKEQLSNCCSPFFTTKKRKCTGFGVSFFKYAAEITGGCFSIDSVRFSGTAIKTVFIVTSPDCIPLGNIFSTVYSSVVSDPKIRFKWHIQIREQYSDYDSLKFCEKSRKSPFLMPSEIYIEKKYLEKILKNIEIYETACADYASCLK